MENDNKLKIIEESFVKECKKDIYNGSCSGIYSDEYVEWLQNKLIQYQSGFINDTMPSFLRKGPNGTVFINAYSDEDVTEQWNDLKKNKEAGK